MKYFRDITGLNELKKEYKSLVKKYHPDLGGSEKAMQQVNNEYEELYNRLQFQENTNKKAKNIFKDDGYKKVIQELFKIPDIEIELVGSWLWVDGDTYKHKKQLKKLGLYWASKKKKWFWRPEEYKKKRKGKPLSMNRIRSRYGSEKIKEKQQVKQLA